MGEKDHVRCWRTCEQGMDARPTASVRRVAMARTAGTASRFHFPGKNDYAAGAEPESAGRPVDSVRIGNCMTPERRKRLRNERLPERENARSDGL